MSMLKSRRFASVVLLFAALLLTGCEQLVAPPGNGTVRYRDEVFTTVTKTADVQYGSAVNQQGATVDLFADIYRPSGDSVTSRPLVVFVHGGSFCCGNKTSPEIVDEANYLAKRGFVTASISYRLAQNGCSAGGASPECVIAIGHARQDAQAAIAWFRANAATYGIDGSRIAIAGSSAGGIVASDVAYASSGNPTTAVRAGVSLSGANILQPPNAGDAPLLLMHGTADFVVPYSWAQNTLAAGTAANVRTVLTSWEGAGHVPYVAHRTEILEQTRNFLWWHMDLAHAAT
jgi:acetyl esterase/lipase